MTDFYSVLKTSIVRRDLRSPADRLEVYDQARKAMIRKLWSFDPPLAEDEIDTRIGLFDAAVERIESDLEIAFAEADALEARRNPRRDPRRAPPPEPQRQPMVYEGYDEEADYMPAFGGRPAVRREDYQPPASTYRGADYYDDPPTRGYDGRRAERQEPAETAPIYRREEPEEPDHPRQLRWRDGEADEDGYAEEEIEAYDQSPVYSEEDYADEDDAEADYRQPAFRPPAYQEPAEWRQAAPPERRRAQRGPQNRWQDPPPETADTYGEAEDRYAVFSRGAGKRKAARPGKEGRQGGSNPVRILVMTIAGLSVLLIAFNVYVFLPIIFGSDEAPPTVAAAPPKVDDRVPVAGAPAATRIVSDSATASEIPERNLDVAESLVVFDGRDPTVFEGASDNPIQFDGDAEGGFARISSATSAAGARAVIGPGLAERLAGRTIRITLLARSSNENGAATMRFAYQSGLAISHWQSADLSANYGTFGMIWRVPAVRTVGAGDYLLIEPGIPGDGTSTDIRSIKIDILAG
jgi:hypothetical protein